MKRNVKRNIFSDMASSFLGPDVLRFATRCCKSGKVALSYVGALLNACRRRGLMASIVGATEDIAKQSRLIILLDLDETCLSQTIRECTRINEDASSSSSTTTTRQQVPEEEGEQDEATLTTPADSIWYDESEKQYGGMESGAIVDLRSPVQVMYEPTPTRDGMRVKCFTATTPELATKGDASSPLISRQCHNWILWDYLAAFVCPFADVYLCTKANVAVADYVAQLVEQTYDIHVKGIFHSGHWQHAHLKTWNVITARLEIDYGRNGSLLPSQQAQIVVVDNDAWRVWEGCPTGHNAAQSFLLPFDGDAALPEWFGAHRYVLQAPWCQFHGNPLFDVAFLEHFVWQGLQQGNSVLELYQGLASAFLRRLLHEPHQATIQEMHVSFSEGLLSRERPWRRKYCSTCTNSTTTVYSGATLAHCSYCLAPR